MTNRVLVVLLVVAIFGIFWMPHFVHRKVGPSVLVTLHTPVAQAQVETGLLASWLLVNAVSWEGLTALAAIAELIKTILPFLNGRPEGQATYCITRLLAVSQNRLVQELSKSFSKLLSWGYTMSKTWWTYTVVANMFCSDMEAKCGFATGSVACQAYLHNALEWNTPCAADSYWGFTLQSSLDKTYSRCQ